MSLRRRIRGVTAEAPGPPELQANGPPDGWAVSPQATGLGVAARCQPPVLWDSVSQDARARYAVAHGLPDPDREPHGDGSDGE